MIKGKIAKTVGWSVFYVFVLIILPPLVINSLPEPILSFVKNSGAINALVGSISYFGVALLVLSAVKNLTSPDSRINLTVSLTLIGAWIYFFYTATNFGGFSIRTSIGLTDVSFDLSPFFTLVVLIGILDGVSVVWGFIDARKKITTPSVSQVITPK